MGPGFSYKWPAIHYCNITMILLSVQTLGQGFSHGPIYKNVFLAHSAQLAVQYI